MAGRFSVNIDQIATNAWFFKKETTKSTQDFANREAFEIMTFFTKRNDFYGKSTLFSTHVW